MRNVENLGKFWKYEGDGQTSSHNEQIRKRYWWRQNQKCVIFIYFYFTNMSVYNVNRCKSLRKAVSCSPCLLTLCFTSDQVSFISDQMSFHSNQMSFTSDQMSFTSDQLTPVPIYTPSLSRKLFTTQTNVYSSGMFWWDRFLIDDSRMVGCYEYLNKPSSREVCIHVGFRRN